MDSLFKIVIFYLCLYSVSCDSATYKAAIVDLSREDVTLDNYESIIHDAAKMNADILLLPSPKLSRSLNDQEICVVDMYEEIVKSISDAAKTFHIYIVAHLLEKNSCLIRNSLVFDREGSLISVYRKPLQTSANCNTTNTNLGTFTTDFGVTFRLLMEEDIILKNLEDFKGLKNFVLAGKSSLDVPFLSSVQFASSWTYMTGANLVSYQGIFAAGIALKPGHGRITVANLDKDGGDHQPTNSSNRLSESLGEDLSQYSIKAMDLEASVHGYQETVCHDNFCCCFHLKTSLLDKANEVNYGLVAFNGLQHHDRHSIGVQICAVVACVGLDKDSCYVDSLNTTNIEFEELRVSGNFTNNSTQFPIVQTDTKTNHDTRNIVIDKELTGDNKQVTIKLYDTQDVTQFGILSRDYTKDRESSYQSINKSIDLTEYISSENVQEFFDYLWIRLKIIIFVVSIYILEMM